MRSLEAPNNVQASEPGDGEYSYCRFPFLRFVTALYCLKRKGFRKTDRPRREFSDLPKLRFERLSPLIQLAPKSQGM